MFAKIALFCAFVAVASAGVIGHLGGRSVSSRRQDDFGNYGFNYQIVNGVGAANGRSEVGDAWGNKRGSYNIVDIDGRARRVEYVADAAGYRAVVKTNEPGTAHSAPAASLTASPYAGPISGSPAVVAHAPIAVAAAPVAVAAAPFAAVGYKGFAGAPVAAAYGGVVGAPFAAAHGGVVGPFGLGYKG